MEPRQVVAEELERGLPHWQDLPEPLRPALERHCENLVALATSLQMAGRDHETIRNLVSELLKSYGADLISALETHS